MFHDQENITLFYGRGERDLENEWWELLLVKT